MLQDQAGEPSKPPGVHGNAGQSTGRLSRWKASPEFLQREVLVIWFVLRNRKTPWHARVIAGSAATYVLSPIQIIPSFIPFIGLTDDVLVLAVAMALIREFVPNAVLQEARQRAETAMDRGESIRPVAVRKITVLVAVCWLALTVGLFLRLHWR